MLTGARRAVHARAADADVQKAFELGAGEYMAKPFDPDELVSAVRNLLYAPLGG